MYNNARCCPTRASLLTGLYPHQAGIGHMVGNYGIPEYQGYLRDDCVTIAEALKLGGYQTLMSGKWHVGGAYNPLAPETWNPGAARPSHAPPARLRPLLRHAGRRGQLLPPALDAGGRHHCSARKRSDGRFLLHRRHQRPRRSDDRRGGTRTTRRSSCTSPTPRPTGRCTPCRRTLPGTKGAIAGGWDALRTARHEELKGLGLVSEKWDISPRDEDAPPWEDVKARDWEDLRMAVYAAQIDRMDQGIGRILAKLRELGIEENTLVIFLSDNGGCAEFLAEDGWCQRYATQTPDGRPIRTGNIVGCAPRRSGHLYELRSAVGQRLQRALPPVQALGARGRHPTPLIVHWPAAIAEPRIEHAPCHVIDLMATCLDAADVAYPDEYNGNAIQPLEGESLVPAFTWPGLAARAPHLLGARGQPRRARWALEAGQQVPWRVGAVRYGRRSHRTPRPQRRQQTPCRSDGETVHRVGDGAQRAGLAGEGLGAGCSILAAADHGPVTDDCRSSR